MFPILLEVGSLHLFSYGTAIVLAALVVGALAWLRRPLGLFSLDQYLTICLLTTIGAAFGARLSFAVTNGRGGIDAFLTTLRLWEKGGLSSFGAPVVALPLLLLYCRHEGLDAAAVVDHLIVFAVLGAAFQRTFGCYLAGCCRGRPTDLPWAVTFPDSGPSVHPTQLYLGVSLFLLFIWLERWRPSRPGLRTLAALGLYALINLAVNFLRSDVGPALLPGLAWAQLLYATVATSCAAGYLSLRGLDFGSQTSDSSSS